MDVAYVVVEGGEPQVEVGGAPQVEVGGGRLEVEGGGRQELVVGGDEPQEVVEGGEGGGGGEVTLASFFLSLFVAGKYPKVEFGGDWLIWGRL